MLQMAWYKKSFGVEYLRVYSERNSEQASREIDFLLGVLQPPVDAQILDLACGAGRHSHALMRRGLKNLVAFDLSEELLALAARETRKDKRAPLYIRGDMRRLPFRRSFDIILSMFTSFGYFEDEEQDALVLKGMARALKAGGRVVLDLPNRRHVEANLVPESIRTTDGGIIVERRRLREKNGPRVEKHISIRDAKRNKVKREFFESVRLYSRDEMERLLKAAGVKPYRYYGDFDGSEFDDSSPRMLIFGRRKDEN